MSIETLSSRRGVEGCTHIAVDTKEEEVEVAVGGCGGRGGRVGGAERDVRAEERTGRRSGGAALQLASRESVEPFGVGGQLIPHMGFQRFLGPWGQASKAVFSDSTRRNGFNGFADSALSISILDTKNLICFFLKKQTKTKYEREKKHQELHRPATVGGPSGAPRAHETTATRACLEHPDRFVNKLCIHVFTKKS